MCDVLKDRKKHSLFNIHKLRSERKQSKQLVEVVVNVSPEHLLIKHAHYHKKYRVCIACSADQVGYAPLGGKDHSRQK